MRLVIDNLVIDNRDGFDFWMAQSAHHVTTAGPSRRVLCDLPSYDLHTLSRSRLAHKWRSSSGWDDKCHTAQHI